MVPQQTQITLILHPKVPAQVFTMKLALVNIIIPSQLLVILDPFRPNSFDFDSDEVRVVYLLGFEVVFEDRRIRSAGNFETIFDQMSI
jgi:hypothetical protein